AFGPDGKLYVTTGDAGRDRNAQDKTSLAGKILRLNDDGTVPDDNPFGTAVWSYGHRNPQGLVWDDQGRLWATEHGRSGILSGFDELNLIEKGKNYGWPAIQGDDKKEGLVTPVINSGANETWAPSGAVYVDGSVFFAGLRGETLYEARVNDTPVTLKKHLVGQYGRLRAVVLGPDGDLYLTTSNLDGRGTPVTDDDRIVRINPRLFR
ncbi:MAG TPA: PQQ-dependent sugar dehydrogenase, partial [Candidatus Methylomirabilis sp.]|nr:PQQ-dependent sugar dehydrogenase [Candidatus Methylomirabilis sp.]